MKLEKLVFENFRQFIGRQTINFSTDRSKNVTLIFGNNGAGKTTVLSAIEWVLYEEFPDDFEFPEQLLHNSVFSALNEGDVANAVVELHIEDKGNRYIIRRTAAVRSSASRQEVAEVDVRMEKIDRGGKSGLVPAPDNLIRNMFPYNLSKFFFFNGERLSDNAAHGFQRLGDEIRFIMGLIKYERAIRRLPKVREKLTLELAGLSSDDRSKKLKNELEHAMSEIATLNECSAQLDELGRMANGKHEDVQQKLRQHAASRELQSARDSYRRDLGANEAQLQVEKKNLARLVNDQSAVIFMREMSEQTLVNAEQLRIRGELPRAVKTQFIDDLLAEGSCICGTLLEEGSTCFEKVKQWRQKAGHAETEEAWITVAGRAGLVSGDEQKFIESFQTALDRISSSESEIDRLENEISAIDKRLMNVPIEEVRGLELSLQALQNEIIDITRQKTECDLRLKFFEETVENLEQEIDAVAAHSEAAELTKVRIAAVEQATELLEAEYAIRLESIRSELELRVNETYGDVINHEYKVLVSPDFVVSLTQVVNGVEMPAARSTAETYALYLAYIAQLSKLNNDLAHVSRSGDSDFGERVPIVMDASFGDFDDTPTRQLVAALPNLSHQIIVLVSKRQGKGLVEDHLDERCGRKSVLTMHVVNDRVDRALEDEQIEVDGKYFDYMVGGTTSDFTSVTEIR